MCALLLVYVLFRIRPVTTWGFWATPPYVSLPIVISHYSQQRIFKHKLVFLNKKMNLFDIQKI